MRINKHITTTCPAKTLRQFITFNQKISNTYNFPVLFRLSDSTGMQLYMEKYETIMRYLHETNYKNTELLTITALFEIPAHKAIASNVVHNMTDALTKFSNHYVLLKDFDPKLKLTIESESDSPVVFDRQRYTTRDVYNELDCIFISPAVVKIKFYF